MLGESFLAPLACVSATYDIDSRYRYKVQAMLMLLLSLSLLLCARNTKAATMKSWLRQIAAEFDRACGGTGADDTRMCSPYHKIVVTALSNAEDDPKGVEYAQSQPRTGISGMLSCVLLHRTLR